MSLDYYLHRAAERNPDGLRRLAQAIGVDHHGDPEVVACRVESAIRVLRVRDRVAR